MKLHLFLLSFLIMLGTARPILAGDAPRARDWEAVAEARDNDQPRTAIKLLSALQAAANAAQAWPEAVKAQALSIALEAEIEGGIEHAIRSLAEQIPQSPEPARPMLRLLYAEWLAAYGLENDDTLRERSATGGPAGEDFETWDLAAFLSESERAYQAALADAPALRRIPVEALEPLLEKGELGDAIRPTLYDFIAHSAIAFYSAEIVVALAHAEYGGTPQQDAFEIRSDSPALDSAPAFLAWQLPVVTKSSPRLRVLRLYQELLAFHQADSDRSAYLHCDLERLQFAGYAAVGANKTARRDAALLAFIEANANHPVSADARFDLAARWQEPGREKQAHDLAAAGAAAFPEHPYGKLCQGAVDELEKKRLHVRSETHWTPAGSELVVEHSNLEHLWLRAYRREWKANAETLSDHSIQLEDAERSALLKGKPALAWDAALPDGRDFKPRSTRLPAPQDLAPGYYWIVAAGEKDFSGEAGGVYLLAVHVTRYALVLRSDDETRLTGLVTDALTGAPVGDVEVVRYQERKLLPGISAAKTRSRDDGWFSLPARRDSEDLLVTAGNGADLAVARASAGDPPEDDTQQDPGHVVLFTDRPLYRPGQTIHFKGVYCEAKPREGSYRTVANKTATVCLMDPNRRELAKQELTTNEWGSFSGAFTAPPQGLLGSYQITVAGRGMAVFSIEQYKRPKFTTTLTPPASPPTLGAKVSATLHATAFTGTPVDGAKVTWKVTRSHDCPAWVNARSGFVRQRGEDAEIASGTALTAADGTLALSFPATPDDAVDPATEPVFRYEIEATVTDPSGETQDADLTVRVGYTAFAARVYAADWQVAGQPVKFELGTTQHSGPPCPAAGTLTIHRLKEPAACPRGRESRRYWQPDDDNDAINPAHWPLGESVATLPARTNPQGEGEVAVPLPAGAYRAVFSTKDANGRDVKATHDFKVVDLTNILFPIRVPFFVSTPRRELEPGEPFTVVWGSGHPQARACVEFFKDRVLLKREWSQPGRTQQLFTFLTNESMRGGITARVTQTTLNRLFEETHVADIPWSNKRLKLRWEHLTHKLKPGAADTWAAVITAPDGSPAAAEMVATLYDASLDQLTGRFGGGHAYDGYVMTTLLRDDPWVDSSSSFSSLGNGFDTLVSSAQRDGYSPERLFRGWFAELEDVQGYQPANSSLFFRSLRNSDEFANGAMAVSSVSFPRTPRPMPAKAMPGFVFGSGGTAGLRSGDAAISRSSIDSILNNHASYIEAGPRPAAPPPPPRRNLHETAFFLPHLTSNDKGEVHIPFTMPEALTTWRLRGVAHDREMRSGTLEGETVTARDLMVQPNPPRFLREGDSLAFTVKITNQSEREQTGTAGLALSDAATLKDVTAALGIEAPEQPWTIPAKQSRTLSWQLAVPDGTGFLNYRATATAGERTDGEEGWLPVIPRRLILTESMHLPIRDAGSREFVFEKLAASGGSPTLEHRSLQIQSVSEPAWYAVLALPYLMEFPHECAEQTFHRYYANALARHLITSQPRLRQLLQQWQRTPALDSPLANNPAPSEVLLEETPWLAAATNQAGARRKLAGFFDDNRLEGELDRTLAKVKDMQREDGLWPWFPGGPANEHITLTIATGFARLREAGVETDITPALEALATLDADLARKHQYILREAKKHPPHLHATHLDSAIAEYLYTRTLFLKDRKLEQAHQAAFDFFVANAKQHWARLGARMSRAHLALALQRLGDGKTPKLITRSLREHAKVTPDTGMCWNDEDDGAGWWQSPIETQALMIEAFREIDHDEKAADDCRVWLITRKQTTDWGSTTATADAVHALLGGGGRDLLANTAPLQVSLGGVPQTPASVEPGTGFHELDFAGSAIKPEFGRISLTKSTPGIAWAGVHWQYLEDLAKVTSHDGNGQKLETTLYVRKPDSSLAPVAGPLKVGDELVTRLIIRNDRPLEFVHLKDQRGSGTEPMNVLSGYRWQDGLGYYETTRDTASHFFIDALPAGTHVFETAVHIQHAGTYQTGIATIRCMYAPAFAAHANKGSVLAW